MQKLLEQYPAAAVRVFAVWEPVRFADWQRPTTAALARLSDSRASQIWDHDHILASQIERDALASKRQPNCCEAHSILFDLVAVYPASAKWPDHLPPPSIFEGPILNVVPKIQPLLSSVEKTNPNRVRFANNAL
ncbi:MAG: hypothetical protein ACR2IV_20515 [Bryobacteraceae bacterium]